MEGGRRQAGRVGSSPGTNIHERLASGKPLGLFGCAGAMNPAAAARPGPEHRPTLTGVERKAARCAVPEQRRGCEVPLQPLREWGQRGCSPDCVPGRVRVASRVLEIAAGERQRRERGVRKGPHREGERVSFAGESRGGGALGGPGKLYSMRRSLEGDRHSLPPFPKRPPLRRRMIAGVAVERAPPRFPRC